MEDPGKRVDLDFEIRAMVEIWDGIVPYYFLTIPKTESSYIRKEFRDLHRGWGSLPINATIGASIWTTSIFWQKKGTYLLLLNKKVRKANNLVTGSPATLTFKLLV